MMKNHKSKLKLIRFKLYSGIDCSPHVTNHNYFYQIVRAVQLTTTTIVTFIVIDTFSGLFKQK